MKDIDFILSPSGFGEIPPKIEDIQQNKESNSAVNEYMMDYYTVLANCLGVPALTIPI